MPGIGAVVWRFDPLILTDKIGIDDLLRKIEGIENQLTGYTEKLVFSFADIASYRKVSGNLTSHGINYQEWTENEMLDFAQHLSSQLPLLLRQHLARLRAPQLPPPQPLG